MRGYLVGIDGMPLSGLRVCYLSTGSFGGVWRTIKQARSLVEAGAHVTLVGHKTAMPQTLKDSGLECTEVESPFSASTNRVWLVRVVLNLTLHRIRNWIVRRNPHRALYEAVVRTGADVVQAVDLPALRLAHDAARTLDASLVYASHELWTGFVRNPDMALDSRIAQRLLDDEAQCIGRADLVIAVSDQMASRLADLYNIRKPLVLLNSPPQRVSYAVKVHQPVRLVFHGGLSADRNLDGLIRAMSFLRGKATLDIRGLSRTIGADALQSLIDQLGLGETIRLHGPFDYKRVIDLLREYDVGVMANKIVEENFEIALPNKLFDCICAGVAVAMSDSPAVRPVVESTGSGILLDPSSAQTIARNLGILIDNPDRIMRMKEAAVKAAPQYWWPEQGRKLVDAFEDMLKS